MPGSGPLVRPWETRTSAGRLSLHAHGTSSAAAVSRGPTLSTFTVDAAAAIDGPDWLRARRAAAAEGFASQGLPSAQEEAWRYSPIDDLDLDAFQPLDPAAPAADASAPSLLPGATPTVRLVDGRVVAVALPASWAAQGVEISRAADLADADGHLGSVATEPTDALAGLNDAFGIDPVVIRIPAGVQVDGPLVVSHHVTRDHAAVFPRLVVLAGAGSAVTVVDMATSADVVSLSIPVVELHADRGANLRYVGVQDLALGMWQIASVVAAVGQEANLLAANVALGGGYARLRTDCRLIGRGASGDLLAAYFGEGDQTLDFRTFQDHRAPDTTSNLLFKGAVAGRSRSVYTGLIRVETEALGTNAFQTNRNIKLTDEPWAESVPNLEIRNNDVHCSHASAVGPVDEEQRFYLESRGVPPTVADRLIVSGFFDEVLRQLPVPGLSA
ncbi:MAG: Fe-S cluster assembly protein SufD, partial [Acidimicrobiales bacterium]|nr:Fe-S cluster assembly protein SufD [Acidimicrobiales bacterium]